MHFTQVLVKKGSEHRSLRLASYLQTPTAQIRQTCFVPISAGFLDHYAPADAGFGP